MKKLMLCICCILLLEGCAPADMAPEADDGRLRIVATVFPAYDFARAAALRTRLLRLHRAEQCLRNSRHGLPSCCAPQSAGT